MTGAERALLLELARIVNELTLASGDTWKARDLRELLEKVEAYDGVVSGDDTRENPVGQMPLTHSGKE